MLKYYVKEIYNKQQLHNSYKHHTSPRFISAFLSSVADAQNLWFTTRSGW